MKHHAKDKMLIAGFLAASLMFVTACSAGNPTSTGGMGASDVIAASTTISDPDASAATTVVSPAAVQTQETARTPIPTPSTCATATPAPAPVAGPDIPANESGKIPILMFHKFVEAFSEKSDRDYTTTYETFEALLETLMERNFHVISLSDFVSGNIDVPAGLSPIVLTFDDGLSSQFSLVRDAAGELHPNPLSAVGVMMRFSERYPEFGLGGTFFVNMDSGGIFHGDGTTAECFQWLLDHGFELGNHTWGHADFHDTLTADSVREAVGRNEQALRLLFPEQSFHSLSLPYGHKPKDKSLYPLISSGEWEGITYRNDILLAVGAAPAVPSWNVGYDPAYVPRIRAQGRVAVEADLTWWLERMDETNLYVSDGDPTAITVPDAKKDRIDATKIGSRSLVVIEDPVPAASLEKP